MGYALAEVAARRGARVILVSGPTGLAAPANVEVMSVETAAQMRDAVLARREEATVIIGAAAVADYTPAKPLDKKMKQHSAFALDLTPTDDIVTLLAKRRDDQLLIGFAAETDNVLENAREKLLKKKMDAIVANDVSQKGIGFDSDSNAVTIITPGEVVEVPMASKREIAGRVLDAVEGMRTTRPVSTRG